MYIVYRQVTTLYPNGEQDHEEYLYQIFSDQTEAWTCAEQANDDPYRDVDEYFFVRVEL